MLNCIYSLCPVAVLMIGSLSSIASPATFPTWALQFGALGLCGYMIWRGEIRQKELVRVIDKQQDKSEEKNQRLEQLVDEHTKSNNRLAEALEHRPCLAGDRVLDKMKGDTK